MMLFTLLNTPSAGFRSGEQWEKTQFGSSLSFNKINNLIHMMVALSIMTTDLGFTPLKGFR